MRPLTKSLIALTLTSGCTHLWASTPYSTAIMPNNEAKSSITLNLGYLTDDATRPGRYTGPAEQGLQPNLNLDYRWKSTENDARYTHLIFKNLGSDNLYLRGRYGVQGDYSVGIEYRERPLFQYQNLQSPYNRNLEKTETQQTWSINQQRERLTLSAQKVFDQHWRLNVQVTREEKAGRRLQGYGLWTGGGTGFEIPAPINQRTDQFDISAEYAGKKLQAKLGYHLSQFSQLDDQSFRVDNQNNNDRMHLSLPPDNQYHQLTGSMAYAFTNNTRFSSELNLGRATQNEAFIADPAYTQALAILGSSLDGQLDTTRLTLRGTHRIAPSTQLRATYRYDDRKNNTATYDGLRSELNQLRDTRAPDLTRHTLDADANIRLPGRSTLNIGSRFEDTTRNADADRKQTQQSTFRARLRTAVTNNLNTGLKVTRGIQIGSNYNDTVTQNNEALRKYHLASIDKTQITANATWNALEQLALGVEVTYRLDDYTLSEIGLQEDNRLASTLKADYFPSRRLSGYAFITHEGGERVQAGINQTLNSKTTTLSFGVGGKSNLTEDGRYSLGGDLLIVNSETDITANTGTSFAPDEVNMMELRLYGDYKASENLNYRLAWLAHQYKDESWAYNTMPAAYNWMVRETYDQTVHLLVGSVTWNF